MLEGRCRRTCRDRGLQSAFASSQRGLHTSLAHEAQSEGRGGRRGVGAVIADGATSQRARLGGIDVSKRVGVRRGRTRGRRPACTPRVAPQVRGVRANLLAGVVAGQGAGPCRATASPAAARAVATTTPPLDHNRTSLTPSHVDDRQSHDDHGASVTTRLARRPGSSGCRGCARSCLACRTGCSCRSAW